MCFKWGNKYRTRPLTTLVFAFIILVSLFSCKTPSVIATQAIQQGDVANNQNDYTQAIQHYSTYLETAPSLGVMRNPMMEAEVCRKLAHAYSTQGKYDQAEGYLVQALELDLKESDNNLNVIDDYRQIGLTQVYKGNYGAALENLNRALDLNKGMETSLKTIKRLSIADTYLSKAQLELTTGLFDKSMEDIILARTIYLKEEPTGLGIIESELLLAKLFMVQNNSDTAIIHVEKSMKLAYENNYLAYRQLQVMADIDLQNGEAEKAVINRQKALEEAEASNINPQIVWACLRLGDAYLELGDDQKAKEYYKRARLIEQATEASSSLTPSIDMRLGDIKNAYEMFNDRGGRLAANIALLKIMEEELTHEPSDSVEVGLNAALAYFTSQNVVDGSFKASILLSKYYQWRADFDKAIKKLDEAELLNSNPEIRWKISFNRALIAEQMGEYDTAKENYLNTIEMIESQRNQISRSEFKWHYLDNKTDVYDALISLLLSGDDPSQKNVIQAYNINERARSRTFLDMYAGRSHHHQDPLIESEQRLSNNIIEVKNLAANNLSKGLSVTNLDQRLETYNEEWQGVVDQLEEKDSPYLSLITVDPVTAEEVIEALSEKVAILELWVGKNELFAWKITTKGITYSKTSVTSAEIKKAVAKTRNLVKFRKEELIVDSFQELYFLLSPVFQNVFSEYDNVVIMPHGSLHFIPFDALYDGEKFIVEQAVVQYSPSGSVYHHGLTTHDINTNNNLLGMALGEFQIGNYAKLPGTSVELRHLSQFYQVNQCVYDGEISETYFKENADDFSVIHVATHGVMNSKKPNRSFVLMTPTEQDDGKLTVEEIFDLDIHAQLVTLSACETGLGDLSEGDELVALNRAFIYAGASSIIVSLWNVDDISTSILMTKMHQLIDAGLSINEALTIAQRELMRNKISSSSTRGGQAIQWEQNLGRVSSLSNNNFSSPYYWAPFIVISTSFEN